MPIIKTGKTVRVEYEIPDDIKNMINRDFLCTLRNLLFRIDGNLGLETFSEYGIPYNTSTNGWHVALWKTCVDTNNIELWDYYNNLPWYDSDIFDGELASMMRKEKLILGYLSDVIFEQLDIKEEELVACEDCGSFFTKDMIVEIDAEDDFVDKLYICNYCNDKRNSKIKNAETTDYYKELCYELAKYTNKKTNERKKI